MKKINLPTLIAISALSWILVNITHEIIDHAGSGVLTGLKLFAVNTTTAYLNVNWDAYSSLRLLNLGGVMIPGYIIIQKSFMPVMKGHRTTLIFITLIAVLTAVIVQTLSLVKNPFAWLLPSQNHLHALVFAYFHFFLWALIVNIVPSSGKTNPIENVFTGKSTYWITIGIIIVLFYIFILGPGIGSFEGHPGLQG